MVGMRRSAFSVVASQVWNSLPREARLAPSLVKGEDGAIWTSFYLLPPDSLCLFFDAFNLRLL